MANSKKKKAKEANAVKVELVPNINAKLGRIYSNYVQISHSPWDFTLRFCDAPPGGDITILKKGDKLEIPTIVEVVIPANLISALITALNDQNEKYTKAFKKNGDINVKGQ